MEIFYHILVASILIVHCGGKITRPNIVLIVADDLGWDDVSFHGSNQILTPNIDILAYSGVALERYYTHAQCTPSRSALLTGKYAYTMGMQGYPLTNSEDRGLPLTEKILPQYLQELGYATHLVGKWHVGHSRKQYLPTNRGFQSYFGNKGGFLDYYEYTAEETWNTGKVSGLDLFRNMSAAWDAVGYITDLYTDEAKSIIKDHDMDNPLFLMLAHNAPHSANNGALLQAPHEVVRTMRHIESPERRIFSAMVKKLDDSIGDVTEALFQKGILNDTIIIFISDNGGMTSGLSINYASNWPLRGIKMSPYEGAVRVVGLLWSPLIKQSNHLWNEYMHVTDWLPTLLSAIGAEVPTNLDGVNLWNNIISNLSSSRDTFYEIDDYVGYASITNGNHKLVTGVADKSYCSHQGHDLRGIIGAGASYEDTIKESKMYSILDELGKTFDMNDIKVRNHIKIDCLKEEGPLCYSEIGKPCLFNIQEDPCEKIDLSEKYPQIVQNLLSRLEMEMKRMMPRSVPVYRDPMSAPRLHNYTWNVFY